MRTIHLARHLRGDAVGSLLVLVTGWAEFEFRLQSGGSGEQPHGGAVADGSLKGQHVRGRQRLRRSLRPLHYRGPVGRTIVHLSGIGCCGRPRIHGCLQTGETSGIGHQITVSFGKNETHRIRIGAIYPFPVRIFIFYPTFWASPGQTKIYLSSTLSISVPLAFPLYLYPGLFPIEPCAS